VRAARGERREGQENASAPIAAATAVGRPRARSSREERKKRVAPAQITAGGRDRCGTGQRSN
jgi:hypothetical protein